MTHPKDRTHSTLDVPVDTTKPGSFYAFDWSNWRYKPREAIDRDTAERLSMMRHKRNAGHHLSEIEMAQIGIGKRCRPRIVTYDNNQRAGFAARITVDGKDFETETFRTRTEAVNAIPQLRRAASSILRKGAA